MWKSSPASLSWRIMTSLFVLPNALLPLAMAPLSYTAPPTITLLNKPHAVPWFSVHQRLQHPFVLGNLLSSNSQLTFHPISFMSLGHASTVDRDDTEGMFEWKTSDIQFSPILSQTPGKSFKKLAGFSVVVIRGQTYILTSFCALE